MVGTTHYVPHHCVFKEDSHYTKVRVVYDASCKSKTGKSLNDNLYCGPVGMEAIVGILIRFRLHQIAIWATLRRLSFRWE